MIPDCDGRSDGQTVRGSDGRTESIIAKTALCIASYADALSKIRQKIYRWMIVRLWCRNTFDRILRNSDIVGIVLSYLHVLYYKTANIHVKNLTVVLDDWIVLLLFVVKENEQIRVAVVSGQRPDLSVITGPETLMRLSVFWMKRCWHQNPEERPSFTGISHELWCD